MSTIPITPPPRSLPDLSRRIRALFDRRETIRFLVSSHLKAGHRDKVLGHLWNILDPLLLMTIYYLVFGLGLRLGGDNHTEFLIYLFIGVVTWRFFETSVSQATQCVRANRGLIHEISFPKAIFPISICLSRLYDMLWGLIVLFAILLWLGPPLTLQLVWLPPLVMLQLLFTAGVVFIVAYLGAFFADTTNVVGVILRLSFYASPIFYHVSGPNARFDVKYLKYYMLNPMACFLESYRSVLLYGEAPGYLPYLAAISALSVVVGFATFSRGEGAFAKYV